MLMMLPFEAPTIFEGIPRSAFRMPRVVKDQRGKFENDDLFRQLSHESAVKYTGFKDRPLEERQMKFIANCQEGHTEVSVVQSGNQFTLMFNSTINPAYNNEGCDFEKEPGKVHIKAGFILNGVCVLWRGWVDLQRLEGFGCLEFDEYRAYIEEAMLKQQIDKQATCNTSANYTNSANPNLQTSPLSSRLSIPNHHAHLSAVASIASGQGPPPTPMQPSALNPNCLGPLPPPQSHSSGSLPITGLAGPPPPPPNQPPNGLSGLTGMPPVSLSDAHYGNAAIAAAAAAAFHQALGVSGPQGGGGLHGFDATGGQSSALAAAAAAAAAASGASLMPPHLPYTNGTGGGPTTNGVPPPTAAASVLPQSQPLIPQQISTVANNIPTTSATSTTTSSNKNSSHHHHNHQHRSPSSNANHHNGNHHHHSSTRSSPEECTATIIRHSVKRDAPDADDQTQLDDVDVVSDIHSTDLDFQPAQPPPRRMFKSIGGHHHDGHHHHSSHHHQHRATRRA